jgi:predicted enzyme related to lactoylglutathione lyase
MPARLAHALIFAAEADRLADFYAAVLGWPQRQPSPGYFLLGEPPAAGLAIHQAPPAAMAPPAAGPPTWREDTAIKPCLEVDDLDAACAIVVARGGATRPPWRWNGRRYVECADPEGNVFQLSMAEA